MGPLVRVLRLVDNEKKPAMRYINEATERAKETIMKSFDPKEDEYKKIFKIRNRKWECHVLNPKFFYGNSISRV